MRVLGLAVFVLAVALAISRLGLILHELVGHGLLAELFGAEVTAWSLHAFGGGWVRHQPGVLTGAAAHLVQLGGIVVELAAAAGAALASRRVRGLARLGLAAAAAAFALHAGWYLAAGTFHGFGDGWRLHRELGAARLALVVPVAIAIVAGTFVAARRLAGALRGHAPAATPRGQLAVAGAALALGLGAHAALLGGELALRTDRTYQATMRTAGERTVDRELAIRVETAERRGRPLDPRAVRAARRQLEERHRELPVGAGLIGAMAIAAIFGVARSRPAARPAPVPPRALALAAAIAAASVAIVVVIDLAAP